MRNLARSVTGAHCEWIRRARVAEVYGRTVEEDTVAVARGAYSLPRPRSFC
jgi:hypothetical protein